MNLTFHTQHKLHKRVYLPKRILDISGAGLDINGWLFDVLQKRATLSILVPEQDQQVQVVLSTLSAILNDSAWCAAANTSLSKMDVHKGISAIEAMETALGKCGFEATMLARRAGRLRLWMTNGMIALGIPKADRIPLMYKSRFQIKRSAPRGLISDLPSAEGKVRRFPSGATPHENLRELKANELQQRTKDLDDVIAACQIELDRHEMIWSRLKVLLNEPDSSLKPLLIALIQGDGKVIPEWVRQASPSKLASTYFMVLNEPSFWLAQGKKPICTPGFGTVMDYVDHALNQKLPRYRLIELFVREIGSQRVMLSVLLALQCHTVWNSNTVLDLDFDGITAVDDHYTLQAFKSRTGDSSPIVELKKEQLVPWKALQFLLRRHAWMACNKWLPKDENRLWLNPVSIQNAPEPLAYVGWGSALREFTKHHGLPAFSLEQVRTQGLSLIALGAGGLNAAQHTAGHLGISTTGHYLDQEIFNRIWSSINYEFQRRLDLGVKVDYEIDTPERRVEFNIHRKLYAPIGDGSSCVNPALPPVETDLLNGTCIGRSCHAGDGCSNRTVIITEESLEAAVRTRRFYQSYWTKLVHENADRFVAVHLTALVFNQAILHIVNKGPHRSRLKAIEMKIEGDENAWI